MRHRSIEGTAYPIKDLEATSDDADFAIERWRPNIVVSGVEEGFGEDAWVQVDVGGEELYCVARCGRCSVPVSAVSYTAIWIADCVRVDA